MLRAVDATRYHYVHAGGLTTWVVHLGTSNGRPLAVVQGPQIAYVAPPSTMAGELRDTPYLDLYYAYRYGHDPEQVAAQFSPHP